MKTNNFLKSSLIVVLILLAGSITMSALADTEDRNEIGSAVAVSEEEEKTETETAAATDLDAPVSGKNGRKSGSKRSERDMDDDERSENRKTARKHGIDFSELPDDPTDEEIVEFFKKYFMGKDSGRASVSGSEEETVKEHGKGFRPFGGHKNCGCRFDKSNGAAAQEAPDTDVPEEQPSDTAEKDIL